MTVRIILADKNPYELDAMCSELASPTTEIASLRDGRDVVALAQTLHPDLVIVAASLGQMGGFAVSRELKMLGDMSGARRPPKIAILIEREADAWLAAWSRCDAWRLKPIDAEELRVLVRELEHAA